MTLQTVAFIAREPGLDLLETVLLNHPELKLQAVFTHGQLPKAEGGGIRAELKAFKGLADRAGVPLHVLDLPEARDPSGLLPGGSLDLLIALSWRCLIPPATLARFRLGGLNLHRGKLPDYAGAEPVRRAIEDGQRDIQLTAHRMTETIDEGEVLATEQLKIGPCPGGLSTAEYAEDVKTRLAPLYAPLARHALDQILSP